MQPEQGAARRVYEGSPSWHRAGKALGLWRVFGNTLPPALNLRYLRYGNRCRVASHREARWSEWPFRREESVTVPAVFTPEQAAAIVSKVSGAVDAGVFKPARDPSFMIDVPRPLDFLGPQIVDIFDGPLGKTLERLLGSPFRIEWLQYYRTLPGAPAKSWLWHIDNDPPFVVKVLIYLTDARLGTGATHMLSLEDTRKWFARGYFGVFGSTRQAYLDGTSDDATVVTMAPGDALVFSTNRLHKGGEVRTGFRDVLSYLILPSDIGWREDAARRGRDYIQYASSYPVDPSQ